MARLLPFFLVLFWAAALWGGDGSQSVLVEKNLFSPDRRPNQGSSVQQDKASELATRDIQLDGVVIMGADKKALLNVTGRLVKDSRQRGGRSMVWVREEESIGDYRILAIKNRYVLIVHQGNTYRLELNQEGKSVSPMEPDIQALDQEPDEEHNVSGSRPGSKAPPRPLIAVPKKSDVKEP